MKAKEFKEEMRLLVENATCETVEYWRRTAKKYTSVVNGRTYTWENMPPEVFAQEQIKRFNQDSRQISRTTFKADEVRIKRHQDLLVWLWDNKDKWQAMFKLRDKYEKHREAIKDYQYRRLWKLWSTDWNDPAVKRTEKIIDRMKRETKEITGSEANIFDICDTIPYNWLALA